MPAPLDGPLALVLGDVDMVRALGINREREAFAFAP